MGGDTWATDNSNEFDITLGGVALPTSSTVTGRAVPNAVLDDYSTNQNFTDGKYTFVEIYNSSSDTPDVSGGTLQIVTGNDATVGYLWNNGEVLAMVSEQVSVEVTEATGGSAAGLYVRTDSGADAEIRYDRNANRFDGPWGGTSLSGIPSFPFLLELQVTATTGGNIQFTSTLSGAGFTTITENVSLAGTYLEFGPMSYNSGSSTARHDNLTCTQCTSLAVDLAYFEANSNTDSVLIGWQTVSEQDNLGFNLYRATDVDGEQMQLNSELIPAQAPGSGQGSTYEFVDLQVTEGESYFYWLEGVDINGETTRYGPVSATANVPTAVSLDGFTIDVPTISLWTLIAFMLTLLMGGWVLRRNVR